MRSGEITSVLAGSVMLSSAIFSSALAGDMSSHILSMPDRDYSFPSCTDDIGQSVGYFNRKDEAVRHVIYTSYAGARFLDENEIMHPAILYDPAIFDGQPDIVLDFVLAHECYHLNSGDARQVYTLIRDDAYGNTPKEWIQQIELDADCGAARRMRDEFRYSAQDMAGLFSIIQMTTHGRQAERDRLANISACYGEQIPFPEL